MNNANLEILLNKINSAPDLGEEILNFIVPYVLKANLLLKEDTQRTQNNQKSLFSKVESRVELENIFSKELPNIVELYLLLPVDYRNTTTLKNGKTQREILLNGIELLVNRMVQIEQEQNKESYSNVDRELLATKKVLDDKYNQLLSLNTGNPGSNLQIETNFDYQMFKKTNPSPHLNKSPLDLNNITESDKKVRFKDESIIVERKDKFKHFVKLMRTSSSKYLTNAYRHLSRNRMTYIRYTVIPLVIGVAAEFYTDHVKEAVVIKTMLDVEQYINAPSEQILKLNYKVLKEIEKENPNLSVELIIGKDKTQVLHTKIKADQKQCVYAIEKIADDFRIHRDFNYYVNDSLMQKNSNTSDRVNETLCSLPENTVEIFYFAKKKF